MFSRDNLNERADGCTFDSVESSRQALKQTPIASAKFRAKSAREDELIATRRKLRPVFLTRGAVTLTRTVRYWWITLASLSHSRAYSLRLYCANLGGYVTFRKYPFAWRKSNREIISSRCRSLPTSPLWNVNEGAIIAKIHCEGGFIRRETLHFCAMLTLSFFFFLQILRIVHSYHFYVRK